MPGTRAKPDLAEMFTLKDSSDLKNLISTLSEREVTLVKILTSTIRELFNPEFESIKETLTANDRLIKQLESRVESLEQKVQSLEDKNENLEQYGRRESLVFSGPEIIPAESPEENTTNIVCDAVKNHLRINLKPSDISVSHRLGRPRSGNDQGSKNRPIIVKLVNRSLKYDLVSACVNLKPKLYINESLTPRRVKLLKVILGVRKTHASYFRSCYTSEGRIIVRLKQNPARKFTITDETSMGIIAE